MRSLICAARKLNGLVTMNRLPYPTCYRASVIIGLMLTLLLQLGCSQLRVPAIDPSGRRVFLPKGNCTQLLGPCAAKRQAAAQQAQVAQTPAFQPPPFTTIAPPRPAPPPQYSNQPAFAPPPTPAPCGTKICQKKPKKHLVPKMKGIKTPGQTGQIIITPSRIVAPVGSEVVVLAGICGEDGYFVKNQPLEWMMSNNSVGEFVEVGGMHHSSFNKLIPPTAKKFSGQYAHGRTGLKKIVLSRGTPTTVDDIELAKGQTFVSVSSSSPGTSYITSLAPKAEGWDRRRATTTIHWVDGRWSVPAPARATAGTTFPLTTVVSRSGDGGGLKGWDVRYAIVGGAPAEFAPTGSQTADASTDTNGQATVQIRQPAGQYEPGTTQVRVDIVRPPVFGESELVVESGITTVTWSAPALTIRAIGPRQAEFDTPFNYRVEITNPGDQVARGVIVRTKNLDDGIEFISSTPKWTEYGRQYEWQLGDVVPGSAPKVVDVQMRSKKRGNVDMCFEVVSPDDRLQTEACAPTEIIVPCIGLTIDGPETASVGEEIEFGLNVKNECDGPLEDIQVRVNFDPGLVRPNEKPSPATFTYERLKFGESQRLPLAFQARQAGNLCFDVEITAKGVRPKLTRRCVVVGAGAAGTNNESPLTISLSGGEPTTVGDQTLVEARVTNRGSAPLERVTLINRFSGSLTPTDLTKTFQYEWIGEELWVNLGRIEAGQTLPIEIRYAGQQVDPDARTEVTVTTPSGANATQSIGIEVRQGTGAPANPGAQPPLGNGAIGIPEDAGPDAGKLSVQVRTLDRNIRVGERSRVEFSIVNGRRSAVQNVDLRMLIPNSVKMIGLDASRTPNIEFVSNVDDRQFGMKQILEMRGGVNETLTWIAIVEGVTPGQAIVEVQAKSDSTVGIESQQDVINVSQ